MPFTPASVEKLSGDKTAPVVEEAHGGISTDANLAQYVGLVGNGLLSGTERIKDPHAYKVLNTETIANAFALGNGNVYVTKGLLNILDNEAELAAVIGHENTHYDKRHIASKLDLSFGATGLALVAKLGLESYRGGALPAGSEQLFNVIGGVVSSLVLNGYSRENENEADAGGLDSMVRQGYDSNSAVTLMQKIAKLAPDSKGIAVYFRSHPNSSERVKTIQNTINAKYPGVSGLLNKDRYDGIVRRGGSLSAWSTGKILGMPVWAAAAAGLIVAGGVGYAVLR